jgi:hypothetical protein
MHFVAAAKRWFNSVESQLQQCSWDRFAELVMSRFGQEHHELLLRQLFQIRHTRTVQEYIDQFSAIVDQLGAYHSTTDPLFFTMRFLDGLKDHIRIPVSMQRPQKWDTACVLALLQEDLTSSRKSEVRKWDVSSGARPFARSTLHPPPPRIDKPGALPETRVYTDPGRSLSADERWAALRSSRRAQGLCIRCGVKWSKDHRCAQAVQLNALEEVLALFSVDDSVDAMEVDQPPKHAEV